MQAFSRLNRAHLQRISLYAELVEGMQLFSYTYHNKPYKNNVLRSKILDPTNHHDDHFPARAKLPYKVRGTGIKGFFLRVVPTGTMSYCLNYQQDQGRDYTIGRHGKITAAIARNRARELSDELAKCNDIQHD